MMNDISDEACFDIKSNPLKPKIGHLRASLRGALGVTGAASPAVRRSAEVKDLISKLIGVLISHKVARKLRSKERNRTVDRELASIYARACADEFDCQSSLSRSSLHGISRIQRLGKQSFS